MNWSVWLVAALSPLLLQMPANAQARIRDVVDVEGVRQNDLVGYGIVVGLNGTGDSVRNSPFTEDSLTHMLERLGVNVQGEEIKPKNVAAVLVTASLPPFARNGSSIDVSVSSIGDASNLEGGTLILTPLKGADNEVYAVAQGSILVSGIDVKAQASRETRGTPTGGSVPNGARIEREVNYNFNQRDSLILALRNPDFTTAARIEDTINASMKVPIASMRDPGTIELDLRGMTESPSRLLASIENLPIQVASPARLCWAKMLRSPELPSRKATSRSRLRNTRLPPSPTRFRMARRWSFRARTYRSPKPAAATSPCLSRTCRCPS